MATVTVGGGGALRVGMICDLIGGGGGGAWTVFEGATFLVVYLEGCERRIVALLVTEEKATEASRSGSLNVQQVWRVNFLSLSSSGAGGRSTVAKPSSEQFISSFTTCGLVYMPRPSTTLDLSAYNCLCFKQEYVTLRQKKKSTVAGMRAG